MAGGWTKDGALQDQIDDTVSDAIENARARISKGTSAEFCDECGDPIPEARLKAVPGVRTCVQCQTGRDAEVRHTTINRRGSKDSQLR